VTINCPYSCSYLRESRLHEKKELDEKAMPYSDVRLEPDFMNKADLVLMLMSAFFNAALKTVPNATDGEAREALDAIVASFREGGEGVMPEGEVARGIVERFREKMGAFVSELKNREGGIFADQVFLGVAVFMARVAHGYDNGKPKGRAYVHYLRTAFPEGPVPEGPE